jgi:murein DD-endopeptidase MepM/ murein hydrolase activator NlpD
MSFEEAYDASGPRSPGRAPDPGPGYVEIAPSRPRTRGGPTGSADALQAALDVFARRAQEHRRQVERGGAMPLGQVENWEVMSRVLDSFLARPVTRRESHAVLRAQSVLEAELEQDGRAYGDMPASLAESVVQRVGLLAVRMVEARRLEKPSGRDGLPRLSWPVDPVSITSLFGYRWHPITGQHRRHLGVDLAAKQGQYIYTAGKGVVLRAGWNGDHGLQVEVQHDGQWVTRYSHLSRVLVEPGQILERGDAVGLAGETGLATGVHLHFELWRDGEALDPLEALGEDEDTSRMPPVALGGGK